MLEVSHLSKIYKTKGGADVKALDDVSVRFPETGMVFLLGKSGSGKSTLLNVCGGLDAPSGGEIIVKGRSSKNFSQSDFDSYRNTFIGFIFQEYNILNEFSVEDNIALALELQGKPKDKAAINKLLEEVDLTGYAKRKPNTLSGGQKQRIAIARALVKAPEIIMADEPTGALDSATGKQVFDTLKKLSKDKLVIVVSHDRDFAEQYGDRVIELKDGKIISDVSKTQEPQKSISANVTAIGDTLCVKKGASLSDKDFEEIKAFLKGADGDIVIATGEKDVKTFKEVSRITDKGEKEVFRDTDENKFEKKAYKPEDSKFIRSKLPMRHAMKIGASGLKTKPFRLIFTVLLCTVAFILFGTFSTMMVYDRESILRESLATSNYDTLVLEKQYKVYEYSYENGELTYTYESEQSTKFTAEEVKTLKTEFGSATFAALPFNQSPFNMYSSNNAYSNYGYYSYSFAHATYLPTDNSLRSTLQGTYPEEGKYQICISTYMAESLMQSGLYDPETEERYTLNSTSDMIGKKLNLNNQIYTISGLFDCGTLDSKFESLKQSYDYDLQQEFNGIITGGMYKVVFVDSATETALLESSNSSGSKDDFWTIYERRFPYTYRAMETIAYSEDYIDMREVRYSSVDKTDKYPVKYFETGKSMLETGEVVVSANLFGEQFRTLVEHILNEQSDVSELHSAFYQPPWTLNPELADSQLLRDQLSISEKVSLLCSSEYGSVTLTNDDRAQFLTDVLDFIDTFDSKYELTNKLTLCLSVDAPSASEKLEDLKIVGFINESGLEVSCLYLNETDYNKLAPLSEELYGQNNSYTYESVTKYVEPENAIYSAVFIPFDKSSKTLDLLIGMIDVIQSDDSFTSLSNPISNGIELADNMIENLSQVFLILGIVLAAFSALLLCNFISVSISHKKRDIGILRAVGARSFDVFKIFFSESFVISIICIVLSIIGSIVVCGILNEQLASMLSGVSVFVFGPLSLLMLIGIALLTAIVATFLPVYNAAKKKPVDSIRAL